MNNKLTRRTILIIALVAVLVAGLAAIVGYGIRTGIEPSDPAPSAVATPVSGLATVPLSELPPEAAQTVALIDAGGPFPYRKDGTVFGNNERLLPKQPTGYYREYTVTTPGSRDRGARRIVGGRDGDLYYTADHYASFRQILR